MANILLIDDDHAVRSTLREILQRSGHSVETAANGREGIDRYVEGKFDLVITDIFMPEMDGIETIIDFRRQRAKTKIIAISGGGEAGIIDYLKVSQKFGVNRIFAKPFEHSDLINAVDELCPA